MNLEATLDEIKKLGVSDRLWLAQAIWESIDEAELPGELTDAQKEDLGRRIGAQFPLRGVLSRGRHASRSDRRLRPPP